MSVSEVTKPLEVAGHNSTINIMAYDLLSTQLRKDEDNRKARRHQVRHHGGFCTSDGCVYSALLALSSMLRITRLSWNITELVKGNNDDHETQPFMTGVTGGGPAACVDEGGQDNIGCCECICAHANPCCCGACCPCDCCAEQY